MKDDEKKKRLLQLLLLKAIKDLRHAINSGKIVELQDDKDKMKVTIDMLKFTKKYQSFTLTSAQMKQVLGAIKTDILSRTPVDTRRLKNSISTRVISANKGEVFIKGKRNNEVAKYQHFGTEAHMVMPKKKGGLLKWFANGRWYSSHGHEVSGIVATEFFKPSAKVLTYVRNLIIGFIKANLKNG